MVRSNRLFKSAISLVIFLLMFSAVAAQKKSDKKHLQGKSVMWERVNIGEQNLFFGPGGSEMQPDLSRITFIEKQKGGSSLKYRIKDGSGRIWVAKIDKESQPETVSVRLTWALGYKSEINYLVPELTIPGKGTFKNVRLEARPEDIERKDHWNWRKNPFTGTNELQGLKIMMAFLNNWDLKAEDNNIIFLNKNNNEIYYVVSDLGATFGKTGNNKLPIFWRLGRSINKPADYSKSKFIDKVENGRIKFAYKGRSPNLFKDVTMAQARWIADLLLQLSDRQIRDAFRAANYSPGDINTYTQAVKNKIAELDRATNQNLAEK